MALLQQSIEFVEGRHVVGAHQAAGDDGSGRVAVAGAGGEIEAAQEPVAHRPSERVAGTEAADDLDRVRLHPFPASVGRRNEHAVAPQLDHGALQPSLQQTVGEDSSGPGIGRRQHDNELVAARVCRQVSLDADAVLLGSEIEAMSDAVLAQAVEQHHLFAKLTPMHKERIVLALRSGGHVVGFMGDGINDAPALRAADIGISVDSAVDIAKEAADIILLEKSLMVLDEGVVEGRTTFCNMLKYIRMTASSNFGNVLSVLVASAFLPFLPMLPLQLLTQNLLYDVAQTGIPFDNVDAELVNQPLKWNPGDIGRFMVFFGPISSLFDLTTFAVMWWVFAANTVAEQRLFQSGWFVVGLLTQTLVVHMIRTAKLPFIESRAAAPLTAMTLAIMALGIWLPMGPLADYFKLQALPPAYFAWLVGILLGYCVLTTAMKRFYIRRFGWQ